MPDRRYNTNDHEHIKNTDDQDTMAFAAPKPDVPPQQNYRGQPYNGQQRPNYTNPQQQYYGGQQQYANPQQQYYGGQQQYANPHSMLIHNSSNTTAVSSNMLIRSSSITAVSSSMLIHSSSITVIVSSRQRLRQEDLQLRLNTENVRKSVIPHQNRTRRKRMVS